MRTFALVVIAAWMLSACGSLSVVVPTPTRALAISGFEMEVGPAVPSERRALLDSLGVLPTMEAALRLAYPGGAGPLVHVTITDFRAPRWGRAEMHAVVQVRGSNQEVLRSFDVDSVTPFTRQTRGWYVRRVSQGVVDQIATEL